MFYSVTNNKLNIFCSYDEGVSDTEDGPCPPLPESADIDELSETECDRHHNSWIVIRGELLEVNASHQLETDLREVTA